LLILNIDLMRKKLYRDTTESKWDWKSIHFYIFLGIE
jgi:hypothetical protein